MPWKSLRRGLGLEAVKWWECEKQTFLEAGMEECIAQVNYETEVDVLDVVGAQGGSGLREHEVLGYFR